MRVATARLSLEVTNQRQQVYNDYGVAEKGDVGISSVSPDCACPKRHKKNIRTGRRTKIFQDL